MVTLSANLPLSLREPGFHHPSPQSLFSSAVHSCQARKARPQQGTRGGGASFTPIQSPLQTCSKHSHAGTGILVETPPTQTVCEAYACIYIHMPACSIRIEHGRAWGRRGRSSAPAAPPPTCHALPAALRGGGRRRWRWRRPQPRVRDAVRLGPVLPGGGGGGSPFPSRSSARCGGRAGRGGGGGGGEGREERRSRRRRCEAGGLHTHRQSVRRRRRRRKEEEVVASARPRPPCAARRGGAGGGVRPGG